MLLKPSKCQSFSQTAGKPNVVYLNINEHNVPSIKDEEQKFFGKKIFFLGTTKDILEYLTAEFKEKLTNLENSSVRNECKLWIYKHFFIPSIRFLLAIHEVPPTSVKN